MNKNYLILPLVAVLVVGAFLAGQYTSMVPSSGTISSQGVIHGGLTCYRIKRTDGTVENLGCKHNLFMDEGKKFLAYEIGTANSTNCTDAMWLANTNFTGASSVGTFDDGTSSGVFSSGGTENLDPASCTGFYLGNWRTEGTGTGNISASCKWTAGATATVWSTALNCSRCSSTAEFFAVNNFTTKATLSSGDELNVTWYVWST